MKENNHETDLTRDLIKTTLAQEISRLAMSRKRIIINNFLGGLAWGLGTAIGATVVFALLGYLISVLGGIPFIGSLIAQIIEQINAYSN
jgi:hypothetical protein